MYRVSDFAEKAGITVRTLHHYDRLGLLKPSGRTEAGYRLYGERAFARLQQIVTLKFIGLPLRARKLAERWSSFARSFTGGDPEVQKGLNKLYADPGGWPASFKKPWSDDVEAFIKKAMAAHKISCA